MEWQPIESAPRDGRFILWLRDEGLPVIAGYRTLNRTNKVLWIWEKDCTANWHDPTHWMPLPDPPK